MWNKILFFIVIIETIKSECPIMELVPVMYEDNFLCANYFRGEGATYPIDGCNSCGDESSLGYYAMDGKDYAGREGHHMPMGSIIIRPGCTFYAYDVNIGNFLKRLYL